MPLQIVRNDITKMKVDAIVNAAKESLLGGGGVDGAIHHAAGPKLLEECRTLHGCKTGEAKITGAYQLPAKYVIHTVGPVWNGGEYHEKELLVSCYQKSLQLAKEYHCQSIAFPLISSGIYGYPKAEALQVAIDTISAFLLENDITAYIVVLDRKAVQIGEKLFEEIQEFIDDHYVEAHDDLKSRIRQSQMDLSGQPVRKKQIDQKEKIDHHDQKSQFNQNVKSTSKRNFLKRVTRKAESDYDALKKIPSTPDRFPESDTFSYAASLEDALNQIDESFSQMLFRKIDEAGMKDSECYKRANIDRKLFSKIRSDVNYKPSKRTVIAFAIALKLPLDETKEMLMKAGYALSHSNKFDIIIEYFICQGNYNIFEINEALFAFDQSLLGA